MHTLIPRCETDQPATGPHALRNDGLRVLCRGGKMNSRRQNGTTIVKATDDDYVSALLTIVTVQTRPEE